MKVSRHVRACDAALAATTWSYLVFAYTVFGHHLFEVPICPWLLVSGNPCPLCGSTHFIGGLLHGDVDIDRIRMAWLLWLIVIVGVGIFSGVRTLVAFQSYRDVISNTACNRRRLVEWRRG